MLPQRRLVVAVETKPDRTALAKKIDADVVVDPTCSHRPLLPLRDTKEENSKLPITFRV